MQTTEEIIRIFEGLKEFYSNKEYWESEHKLWEEKFQILVHVLQNEKLPRNSRKFVEELRKVRQQRWIVSRICLLQNPDIKSAIGNVNTIYNPKIREVGIRALQEYADFVKSL